MINLAYDLVLGAVTMINLAYDLVLGAVTMIFLFHKNHTTEPIVKNFYGRIRAMTDSDNYSSSTAIILQGPTNPSHKNYYMEQEWALILLDNLK